MKRHQVEYILLELCGDEFKGREDYLNKVIKLSTDKIIGLQTFKELAADDLWIALAVLMDNIDFTNNACSITEMVGAVLPKGVLERANEALTKAKG